MRNGMINAKEVYAFLGSLPPEHPAGNLWREAKTWGNEIFGSFWMRAYFKSLDEVHSYGSWANPDIDEPVFVKPAFMNAANDNNNNMKGAV
jgi:hypothetical protein